MSLVQLIDKYHTRPWFVLVLALVLVAWISYALHSHATVSDLQRYATLEHVERVDRDVMKLTNDVGGVLTTLRRMEHESRIRTLEERIRSTEMEVYRAERLVEHGEATERDYEQLNRLRSDLSAYQRELARINY